MCARARACLHLELTSPKEDAEKHEEHRRRRADEGLHDIGRGRLVELLQPTGDILSWWLVAVCAIRSSIV